MSQVEQLNLFSTSSNMELHGEPRAQAVWDMEHVGLFDLSEFMSENSMSVDDLTELRTSGRMRFGGGAAPIFDAIKVGAPYSWFELSKFATPGTRVVFAQDWEIFPICIVPKGTVGVVIDNGLNDIWGGLLVLPDNKGLQNALRDWDGQIHLGVNEGLDPGTDFWKTDPNDDENNAGIIEAWHTMSPLSIASIKSEYLTPAETAERMINLYDTEGKRSAAERATEHQMSYDRGSEGWAFWRQVDKHIKRFGVMERIKRTIKRAAT